MKKVLIFAPKSPHTAKFIEMIDGKVDYVLIAGSTNLTVDIDKPYVTIKQASLKGVLTIIKNLWFTKHDYVHVHSVNLTAFIVSIFAIKPIIVTAWGSDILIVPKRSKIHELITKFVLWRAKTVSVNATSVMRNAARKLSPSADIRDIHFGISRFCKRRPFAEKENIIYSPRGHTDLYNIDKVIKQFRKFSVRNPEWKLVISGMPDTINTPKLKEQAKGLNVEFTGWITQEQHAKWMERSKIMISIPSSDALSVTLMEAIYSNCVSVVSDLPANREVITEGVNGFIGIEKLGVHGIDIQAMELLNAELSTNWTFEYNQKAFLSLY